MLNLAFLFIGVVAVTATNEKPKSIDILMVFTSKAVTDIAASGYYPAGTPSFATYGAAKAQECLDGSTDITGSYLSNIRLNVVGTMELSWYPQIAAGLTPHAAVDAYLNIIKNDQAIFNKRAQLKADLVVTVFGEGEMHHSDVLGFAEYLHPHLLVRWRAANYEKYYSLMHEIGHVFTASHDDSVKVPGQRTIMEPSKQIDLNLFSYVNAATVQNNAHIVRNWYRGDCDCAIGGCGNWLGDGYNWCQVSSSCFLKDLSPPQAWTTNSVTWMYCDPFAS